MRKLSENDGRATDDLGRANAWSGLGSMALKSLGVGVAVGGTVGVAKLLKDYLKSRGQLGTEAEIPGAELGEAVSPSVEALLAQLHRSRVPAKIASVDGMVQDLAHGATIGALTPIAFAAPALAGFFGTNYLVDVYRKKRLEKDLESAKSEFERALSFDDAAPAETQPGTAPKLAAADIGRQIDMLFYELHMRKQADRPVEIVNLETPPLEVMQRHLNEKYAPVQHDPRTDSSINQSNMSMAGWLAAIPLGVGALGAFMYAKNRIDADPEIKRRKELKQLLRRQRALDAGADAPIVGEDGNAISLAQ